MEFDGFHTCSVCCNITEVVKNIITAGDSGAVYLIFLRTFSDNVAGVGDFPSLWDSLFFDPIQYT